MSDDLIRELDGRKRQVLRIIEQAAANVGMHSDAVVSQARDELNTIEHELADLYSAKNAQAQAVASQMTGHRFDRPLTDAGKEAIASARAELEDAKQKAANAIDRLSRELSAKAAELDSVMTEHGQFVRYPALQSVQLDLIRLAEKAFNAGGIG